MRIDESRQITNLGPALANIFIGYYKSKLFQTTSKLEMYYRYMDDTFVVFSNEDDCDLFLDSLNSLHPSLALLSKKNLTWLSHFWMFFWKIPFQVHYFHLSETHIHRSIFTLEFFQSSETQNQSNPYINSPGSCHLFSWKIVIGTRQNQVHSTDQWIPRARY